MVKNHRGFSLVELLVVTVIMGLVIGAVYTLYLSTQKTAITSEEVVDVQQNLRFALDQMAKDIRMAGFLVVDGSDPLESEPASLSEGNLIINTSAITPHFAQIVGDESYDSSEDTFFVGSGDMVDLFDSGDEIIIIRAETEVVPGGAVGLPPVYSVINTQIFTGEISGKDRNAPSLTIDPLNPVGTVNTIDPGDVIVRASTGTVTYELESEETNVNRILRNGEPLADKIVDVEFVDYIRDDSELVAVRIRIVGQTDETMTGREGFSGIKTRALESVVRLRNR